MRLDDLLQLVRQAQSILADEPSHVALPADRPIVFVGDLHGDAATAAAIIERFAGTHRMVFLGDVIDRAPTPGGSVETIALLLRTKLGAPQPVHLLRGNHEFRRVFRDEGFGDALLEMDGGRTRLLDAFEELFSQLPYVATTDNGVICLHGGLPNIQAKQELLNLPKGVTDYLLHPLISQTVWNDNVQAAGDLDDPTGCVPSTRVYKEGYAYVYGEPYFSEKMALLGKNVLVRGHDFRVKGYSLRDRVLTILTSRQYVDEGNVTGSFVALLDPQAELRSGRDLELIPLNVG